MAAMFDNRDTIKYLLKNHVEKIIYLDPKQLYYAIKFAFNQDHFKALELLLLTEGVLKELYTQSAETPYKYTPSSVIETFKEIEELLNNWKKDENIPPEAKKTAAKALKTINGFKNKEILGASVAAAIPAVAATTAIGFFTAAVLASKSQKVKNCRLVINYLVPAFNELNNQLTIDLNKVAKALVDPKIAGLIIGMTAILGVIGSIVVGSETYKHRAVLF